MKFKRSTIIPAILLVYLAVMAVPGYKQYASGAMSATEYFGIIAATVATVIALHFALRRRERLRAEREADMRRQEDADNDRDNRIQK